MCVYLHLSVWLWVSVSVFLAVGIGIGICVCICVCVYVCVRVCASPLLFPLSMQPLPSLELLCSVREGEALYDYSWYPHFLASDAASCCFLTTCRATPIHLRESDCGKVRAVSVALAAPVAAANVCERVRLSG